MVVLLNKTRKVADLEHKNIELKRENERLEREIAGLGHKVEETKTYQGLQANQIKDLKMKLNG